MGRKEQAHWYIDARHLGQGGAPLACQVGGERCGGREGEDDPQAVGVVEAGVGGAAVRGGDRGEDLQLTRAAKLGLQPPATLPARCA